MHTKLNTKINKYNCKVYLYKTSQKRLKKQFPTKIVIAKSLFSIFFWGALYKYMYIHMQISGYFGEIPHCFNHKKKTQNIPMNIYLHNNINECQ